MSDMQFLLLVFYIFSFWVYLPVNMGGVDKGLRIYIGTVLFSHMLVIGVFGCAVAFLFLSYSILNL